MTHLRINLKTVSVNLGPGQQTDAIFKRYIQDELYFQLQ